MAMENLVCRTDAIFHRWEGVVETHPTHWVIRTPHNPRFWFGNYVLFRRAPQGGDLADWLAVHRDAFGTRLNHVTLGWDEPVPGATAQFVEAGFKASHGVSFSISGYSAGAKINPRLTVRALRTTAEWEAMVEQHKQVDRDDFGYPVDDSGFRTRQLVSARRMAEAGRGDWWGAYLAETLVGGMGLFYDERGTTGRFQYVTTSPAHRRQRVCTTLLDHVVRHAFETVRPGVLVISTGADEGNPALNVYQGFGFKEAMRSYAFTRLTA